MSIQSQQKNMKDLANLLANDLGYIYGNRESGPNGAKSIFLSKGRAFMRALGQDLHFSVQKLNVNKAGIAVSGEVYLYGMWPNGYGLYICLEQMRSFSGEACILYRTIDKIDDYNGGHNQYVSRSFLGKGDYEALLDKFLLERKLVDTLKIAA